MTKGVSFDDTFDGSDGNNFLDTFKLKDEEDVEVKVMNSPTPKKMSFKKALSMRRSVISGELAASDVKFSRRTSQIVTELEKLDKDGDGNINALDIAAYVDKKLQTKAKLKYWKWIAISAFLLFVLTVGVNMSLTYAVVELAKDTKYENNEMTLKGSGSTVLTGRATKEAAVSDGDSLNRLLRLLADDSSVLDNLEHFHYEEDGVTKGFQVTGYELSKNFFNQTSVTLVGSSRNYTIAPYAQEKQKVGSRRRLNAESASTSPISLTFGSNSRTASLLTLLKDTTTDSTLVTDGIYQIRGMGWGQSLGLVYVRDDKLGSPKAVDKTKEQFDMALNALISASGSEAAAKASGEPRTTHFNNLKLSIRARLEDLKRSMKSKTGMILDCGTTKTFMNELCYKKQSYTINMKGKPGSYFDYLFSTLHVGALGFEKGQRGVVMQNRLAATGKWALTGGEGYTKNDAIYDSNYQTFFMDQNPVGIEDSSYRAAGRENGVTLADGQTYVSAPDADLGLAFFAFLLRSRALAHNLLHGLVYYNQAVSRFNYHVSDHERISSLIPGVPQQSYFGGEGWETYMGGNILEFFGVSNHQELLSKFCDEGMDCWIAKAWREGNSMEGVSAVPFHHSSLVTPIFPASELVYADQFKNTYTTPQKQYYHHRYIVYHANGALMTSSVDSASRSYHLMFMNANLGDDYLSGFDKNTGTFPEDHPCTKLGNIASVNNACRLSCYKKATHQNHQNYEGFHLESTIDLNIKEARAQAMLGNWIWGKGGKSRVPNTHYCEINGLEWLRGMANDRISEPHVAKPLFKLADEIWAEFSKEFTRREQQWAISLVEGKGGRPVLNMNILPADLRLITEMFKRAPAYAKLGANVAVNKEHGSGVWQSSVWQSSVWEAGSQSAATSGHGKTTGRVVYDGEKNDDGSDKTPSQVWQSSVWGTIWQSSIWGDDDGSSSMDVWQSSVWQSSVWQSSIWQNSVWQSSVWGQSSVWQSSVWGQNSIWQSSVWQSSVWQSSVWGQSSVWQNSVWQNSVWQSSVWQNSVWGQSSVWQSSVWGSEDNKVWQSSVWGQNSIWGQNSVWQSSVWQNSVWQNSVWQNSVWQSSIWQSSIWQSSIWESLSSATFPDVSGDFVLGEAAQSTFKDTDGASFDLRDDGSKDTLQSKIEEGSLQIWQSSIWQSSVWQSSVWDQSDSWESRAIRIMQNSVWQSSVWTDEEYWWVGKVWRQQAVAFDPADAENNVMPMSWKGLTLTMDLEGGTGGSQTCPPLHLKHVKDSQWKLPTTSDEQGQVDSGDTTCPTKSISLPASGLGEDVHVFIFDTGVDVMHPDLMSSVYQGDMDPGFSGVSVQDEEGNTITLSDNGHYNAITAEAECDIDVSCILKYGDKDLNSKDVMGDSHVEYTASSYCMNPLVDCHGHGTHTASLAVGSVSGVAKRAILHSVRVANCKGIAQTEDIVKGLKFVEAIVTQQKWKAVVSLSLGGEKDADMDRALMDLINIGVPAVCAAGNTGQDSLEFSPAGLDNCITVGAADPLGNAATFSNYGPALDVFAPGVEVTTAAAVAEVCRAGMVGSSAPTLSKTTYPGDDIYTSATGTSFACPVVTGIVAAKLSEGTYREGDSDILFGDASDVIAGWGVDACGYLQSSLEASEDSGRLPCSTYMQAFIRAVAKDEQELKYRTPSATVTTDGTGSDSYTKEAVADTTTKFAQWDYSGETERPHDRRSLQSFGNETATERRRLQKDFSFEERQLWLFGSWIRTSTEYWNTDLDSASVNLRPKFEIRKYPVEAGMHEYQFEIVGTENLPHPMKGSGWYGHEEITWFRWEHDYNPDVSWDEQITYKATLTEGSKLTWYNYHNGGYAGTMHRENVDLIDRISGLWTSKCKTGCSPEVEISRFADEARKTEFHAKILGTSYEGNGWYRNYDITWFKWKPWEGLYKATMDPNDPNTIVWVDYNTGAYIGTWWRVEWKTSQIVQFSEDDEDDLAPLLTNTAVTEEVDGGVVSVNAKCFAGDDNTMSIEVLPSSGNAACKDVPLSIIITRLRDDAEKASEDDKEMYELVFETEAMQYDASARKYVYKTTVKLQKGCYTPALYRHRSAYKAQFLSTQVVYNNPSAELFHNPINFNFDPTCSYQVNVLANGQDIV